MATSQTVTSRSFKPVITARLSRNKHESEFFVDGKPLSGIEDARVEYIGKNQVLVLVLRDFKILPESRCPERNRFERVMQAFGDENRVAALKPSCNMIRMNPRACDGCPDRPL